MEKKKSYAITPSDCKIRLYSVHTGTYTSAFGITELLPKLIILRFRFLRSSNNFPEQHKCLFDSELQCCITQPVTYAVVVPLLVCIDLTKIRAHVLKS